MILNIKGKEVLIDDDDFEKVSKYPSWQVEKWGVYYKKHVSGTDSQINIRMHRLIMGLGQFKEDKRIVDHINHDVFDNRKENLRVCTNQENSMNRGVGRKNNSGNKGVYRQSRTRWVAHIKLNKKDIYLGSFDRLKKAVIAYNKAAKKYFGNFAYLNPVDKRVDDQK